MGLRNVTGHGQHHTDGVFCCGNGVGIRRVYDHNTSGCGGWNIDVIHTNASAADNFQVGGSVDNLLSYLRLTASN